MSLLYRQYYIGLKLVASLLLVASGAAPAIIGNTQKYNAVQEEIHQQQQQSIDDKAKRAAELQARIQAKMSGKVSVDVLESMSEMNICIQDLFCLLEILLIIFVEYFVPLLMKPRFKGFMELYYNKSSSLKIFEEKRSESIPLF